MRLAQFIVRDMQAILARWEAFAGTRLPAASGMTPLALAAMTGNEEIVEMLLDAGARVQYMNRSARAILNRGHGLAVRNARLVLINGSASTELSRVLNQRTGSALLRIRGPKPGQGEYRVLVSALDASRSNDGFCVFIHEPHGTQRPLPSRVLRELYRLSAAEARLVNALFVGQSLRTAAESLGVSHHTARSVLKNVFVKCEVRTQAGLLQTLALGPRAI